MMFLAGNCTPEILEILDLGKYKKNLEIYVLGEYKKVDFLVKRFEKAFLLLLFFEK